MVRVFSELLANLPDDSLVAIRGDLDVEISAPAVEVASEVQPGGVFVARKGLSADGHDFISQAVEKGAAAVVGERPIVHLPVPYAQVHNAQRALGFLAAAYHDFPSRKMVVIGVTGTDGKTTTSMLIHSILREATGNRAGYISTIAAHLGDKTADTGLHVTTPSAPQVQAYLAQMAANGLTHCVLEMTSHGLSQGRLNGVDVDVAVLTNLTHEHLDYHGTFEQYRAAKGLLFERLVTSQRKLGQPKIGVVNGDDLNADYFAAIPADRVVRYGLVNDADYVGRNIRYMPDETSFDVHMSNHSELISSRLLGQFNVMNILAAVAATHNLTIAFDAIRRGVANVTVVSGRMERIIEGQDFVAMVDFAHTPNALKNALEAARQMVSHGGRLIAVFGSAGLRDVEKRRMMAETSAQLADFTVLTAEDPRTESLDSILQMMAEGCIAQGGVEFETFIRVPDRGEALYQACRMAKAGDVVIACGKGHEQSMCFGTVEYPWDDREALRAALRGEPLRTLPTAKPLV